MAYNLTKGTWFKEACAEQGYIVFDPKYIKEAEKYGVQFGTGDFIVYQYLRWCEDSGKYRIMVAGYEHIKKRFGFEKAEDVRNALNHLARLGAVNHIWCDTKIYRSKTQIWVSTEHMKSVDASPVSAELSTDLVDGSTKIADPSTQATPVLTPVGNNNINNKREGAPTFEIPQNPQEPHICFSDGKPAVNDAETANGNPFEEQSIYDAVGTTESVLRENERKRKQIEISEVCLAVASEFGDTRLARNKKLRPRIAALLDMGYTRWDITRVAHNWHDLKDKQGQLFGFGIFSDTMFPTLLKQEPKAEIWTR